MIEEDWGALEGSEWGSAPLAEAATVKPVPPSKKDTPQKAKIQKNKKKKLKVLDSEIYEEKPNENAPTQPKKKVMLLQVQFPVSFSLSNAVEIPIYKIVFIEKQE